LLDATNLTIRGKDKGAKGRSGLTGPGVELLPISMKSISTPIPSTHIGMFAGSSRTKTQVVYCLVLQASRCSLHSLHIRRASSAFPIRSPRNPFKFSMFNDQSKSRSYARRSKSLSVPTRHLAGSSPLSLYFLTCYSLSSSTPHRLFNLQFLLVLCRGLRFLK
jgi:hypothetical protein